MCSNLLPSNWNVVNIATQHRFLHILLSLPLVLKFPLFFFSSNTSYLLTLTWGKMSCHIQYAPHKMHEFVLCIHLKSHLFDTFFGLFMLVHLLLILYCFNVWVNLKKTFLKNIFQAFLKKGAATEQDPWYCTHSDYFLSMIYL